MPRDGRAARMQTSAEISYSGVPSEIHRLLRDRILRGELRSGEPVKIHAVAAEFGVSIIPVREAIQILAADHLIRVQPRRSPIVTGISKAGVLEIGRIRLAVEPPALAAAIPSLDRRTIRSARMLLRKYRQSKNPWEQVELNRRFHLMIYEPCGMPRLLRIISEQYDGLTRCAQVMVIRSSRAVDRSVKEHEAILEACEAKHVAEAGRQLRSHLRKSITRLRKEPGILETN